MLSLLMSISFSRYARRRLQAIKDMWLLVSSLLVLAALVFTLILMCSKKKNKPVGTSIASNSAESTTRINIRRSEDLNPASPGTNRQQYNAQTVNEYHWNTLRSNKSQVLQLPERDGSQYTLDALQLKDRLKLGNNSIIIISLSDEIVQLLINKCCGQTDNKELDDFLTSIIRLSDISIVFLLCKATSDEQQMKLQGVLDTAVTCVANIPSHRVLFYETVIGKIAIARQLKPVIYIDNDADTCDSLAPHIRDVINIGKHSLAVGNDIMINTSHGSNNKNHALVKRMVSLSDVTTITA